MNATPRLLEVTDALSEAGLRFLIMGGHAVRHYGVERNTLDFDFHISADQAPELVTRLKATRFGARNKFNEGASWRPGDFRRFQIGVLPNGKEEWLEFWFRNHLLAPFEALYERREESIQENRKLNFLSLSDLIRSKETERGDDWDDIRLLEEIQDQRFLAVASTPRPRVLALSQLRSRRGFERAEAGGLFRDPALIKEALGLVRHPVTWGYLLPFVPDAHIAALSFRPDATVESVLRRLEPSSARHLAVVEALRLAYQRSARAADRADKEQRGKPR